LPTLFSQAGFSEWVSPVVSAGGAAKSKLGGVDIKVGGIVPPHMKIKMGYLFQNIQNVMYL